MILAKIIARDTIIGINDDFGLKALDGYFESPVCEFKNDCSIEELAYKLIDSFESEINKLYDPRLQLVYTYK